MHYYKYRSSNSNLDSQKSCTNCPIEEPPEFVVIVFNNFLFGDSEVFHGSGTQDVTLSPGQFEVVEDPTPDFTTSYSGACSGNISGGQHLTCTITNNGS